MLLYGSLSSRSGVRTFAARAALTPPDLNLIPRPNVVRRQGDSAGPLTRVPECAGSPHRPTAWPAEDHVPDAHPHHASSGSSLVDASRMIDELASWHACPFRFRHGLKRTTRLFPPAGQHTTSKRGGALLTCIVLVLLAGSGLAGARASASNMDPRVPADEGMPRSGQDTAPAPPHPPPTEDISWVALNWVSLSLGALALAMGMGSLVHARRFSVQARLVMLAEVTIDYSREVERCVDTVRELQEIRDEDPAPDSFSLGWRFARAQESVAAVTHSGELFLLHAFQADVPPFVRKNALRIYQANADAQRRHHDELKSIMTMRRAGSEAEYSYTGWFPLLAAAMAEHIEALDQCLDLLMWRIVSLTPGVRKRCRNLFARRRHGRMLTHGLGRERQTGLRSGQGIR